MFVFVYGTLKKGKPLHGWLNDIQFVSEGYTSALTLYLPSIYFPYPFCVEDSEGDGVYGEVYKIDDEQLKMLDMVEGYPDLYNRKFVTVTTLDGSKCKCVVYIITDDIDSSKFDSSIKF